jgi:hypothetical protein
MNHPGECRVANFGDSSNTQRTAANTVDQRRAVWVPPHRDYFDNGPTERALDELLSPLRIDRVLITVPEAGKAETTVLRTRR